MIRRFSGALFKAKDVRTTISASHRLFGILNRVLAVSTFMLPEDIVLMLLEDRRNRAVTSETPKHSHEIIV